MLIEHLAQFEYPGLGPVQRSVCDLYVYDMGTHLIAVASERDDNPGASVTNTAEHAASAVLARFAPGQPDRLLWVERYPASRIHGPEESISKVEFEWDAARQGFHAPGWTPSSREELEGLLGEPFPEPTADATYRR